MLSTLEIKNFLLIEDIQISFEKSFTVITGETGAGKSIIIQALMLALGEKLMGRKVIRSGSKMAIIGAIFDITNNKESIEYIKSLGIEVDNELILRRQIYEDGKSKIFINDIAVTMQSMTNLCELILEICGQHSSRSLLDKSNHLKLIDEYSDHVDELIKLSTLFENYTAIKTHYKSLLIKKDQSEIERDFLETTIKELSALKTYEGEEDSLIEKRNSVADVHKTTELIGKISKYYSSLNLQTHMYTLQKDVERGGEIFSKALFALTKVQSELKELDAQIEDVVNNFNNDIDMEQIESRLYKIRSVARKYSILTSHIDNFLQTKIHELSEINNLDALILKAKHDQTIIQNNYLELAKQLSAKRKISAKELKNKIETSLQDVKMEKVEILINIEELEDTSKWTAKGINKIEFLVRTNHGINFGEIAKIASGGELSRIMLAIKLALSEKSSAGIIIFDEIDTGISGATSSAVGKKLFELSKVNQVVAITHQPQVAAYGRNHLHVSKVSRDNSTHMVINKLSDKAHLDEIARMISGEKVTEQSLAAAKSLVQESFGK